MSISEITDKLNLHSLTNHQWHAQATSAITGDGINEGFDWLSKQIKNMK